MKLRSGMIIFAVLIAGALFVACSRGGFIGEGEPPLPKVTADGISVPVSQSSYCWGSKCADYADAKTMLQNNNKTAMRPGTAIKIAFKGAEPRELHVTQQTSDGTFGEVKPEGNSFSAPTEPGIYYYAVSGWWKGGSSSGVFAIEVK